MKTATKLIIAATLLLGAAPAMAQSAYTTGSAASNAAAGYPSQFGRTPFAAAPAYSRSGMNAYGAVGSAPYAGRVNNPGENGGGSTGYNQMQLEH